MTSQRLNLWIRYIDTRILNWLSKFQKNSFCYTFLSEINYIVRPKTMTFIVWVIEKIRTACQKPGCTFICFILLIHSSQRLLRFFFLIETSFIKYWSKRWTLVRHILRIPREMATKIFCIGQIVGYFSPQEIIISWFHYSALKAKV